MLNGAMIANAERDGEGRSDHGNFVLKRKFVLLNLGSSLTVYSLKWYFRTQSVDTFFKKIS